jgi:alkyl sulfatase BDS1-like metallo-beta-lactamase superfamily hydrolase
MTNLSPAAQTVLDAWSDNTLYTRDKEPQAIAAALRAAAHKVVPFPGRYPMNEYMEGIRDAKQYVHQQLLAIAEELSDSQ